MNERELLLRKISAVQFAAWELHIYLDTHPYDTEALASYRKYQKQLDAYVADYEKLYGPLTPSDSMGDGRWEWINSPWPWEIEGGDK